MDGFLRHSALPYQINHTTDDGVSTAIWTPPVPQEASDAHAEGLALAFQNCFGERLERFQQGFGLMQTKRPHKPHWYLSALATHPDWHGQGLGSTVLRPILQRCDSEGVPAYLESTKEKNVAFYRRHRFDLTSTLDLPDGGPTLYLMWREPQRTEREPVG